MGVISATDDLNARRIETYRIFLNVTLPWKERLVKIRLPSGTDIEDRFLKRKPLDDPLHISNHCLPHFSP